MTTAQELADRALALAAAAYDELAQLAGGSDRTPADDAFHLVHELDGSDLATSDPATWQRHAAMQLLVGVAACMADDSEDEDDGSFELLHQGEEALAAGDATALRAVGDQLLELAANTDAKDWNYGNLVHHGHIFLGQARLAVGDTAGAADELRVAGLTPGSPQLGSFGPDLVLAFALLRLGEEAAVLDYLRSISTFWSPIH